MREKIAETTCSICKFKSWCEFDARERNAGAEVDAIADCPHITALEALFTTETAAMRGALEAGKDELWRLRHCSTERPQRTLDVISQMNTALKGGKND